MRICAILMILALSAHAPQAGPIEDRLRALADPTGITDVQSRFTCSRKTCGQMRSCAEACHALTVCGDRRRDGDGDGIPCENLCSRRC